MIKTLNFRWQLILVLFISAFIFAACGGGGGGGGSSISDTTSDASNTTGESTLDASNTNGGTTSDPSTTTNDSTTIDDSTTSSRWTLDEGIRIQPSDVGVEAGLPVADISVVILPDDTYRAYYIAQNVGILSSTSTDGLNFTLESGVRLSDGHGQPRVVKLSDGRYRLFFTGMVDREAGIGSAISSDGLNFTEESGIRIKASDFGEDSLSGGSLVTLDDNTYRMYFSRLPMPDEPITPFQTYSAVSSDMLNWTPETGVRVGEGSNIDKSAEHPFVIKKTDGTFRMFFYVNDPTASWTATSTDGLTWENAEETGITGVTSMAEGNDPDIVVLPDGRWRMYYGDFDTTIGGFIRSTVASEY